MLLSEQLADLAVERVTGFTYLFAKTAEGQGYFVVVDRDGLGVLDRAAYRAIAAERTQAGLSPLLHVFARLSTYSGPNLRVDQPGWR
jgi:adenine-specific DNA-methyltransferase